MIILQLHPLSEYQLKIPDLYSIPISNIKKFVPNFFGKEKYAGYYENLTLYLRLGLKLKDIHRVIEINPSQSLKQFAELNTQKRIEARKKNGDKNGKVFYKLMNNAVYGKTIKNLRHKIDIKLVSNKKDYLKWTSKPSYMAHKIFDNDLVVISKTKLHLRLKNLHTLECVFWKKVKY